MIYCWRLFSCFICIFCFSSVNYAEKSRLRIIKWLFSGQWISWSSFHINRLWERGVNRRSQAKGTETNRKNINLICFVSILTSALSMCARILGRGVVGWWLLNGFHVTSPRSRLLVQATCCCGCCLGPVSQVLAQNSEPCLGWRNSIQTNQIPTKVFSLLENSELSAAFEDCIKNVLLPAHVCDWEPFWKKWFQ